MFDVFGMILHVSAFKQLKDQAELVSDSLKHLKDAGKKQLFLAFYSVCVSYNIYFFVL